MIGGVGEIGRSLSQMLKQGSKLDVLALYDVAASNKRFSTPFKPRGFTDGETVNSRNSRMLTMLERTKSNKGDCQTEELVESLRRLPIAEECAKPTTPQGDNGNATGSEGPRVLAEMGPASFRRHGGRIVSEIYKQLPDFATYLGKNRQNNTNNTTLRRRYSNIALFSNEYLTNIGNDLQFGKTVPDFVVYPNKLSRKPIPVDRNDKKCHPKRKDTKKLNTIVAEQIEEKKPVKLVENRPTTVQKSSKKKRKIRRFNESRIIEEEMSNVDRGSNNFSKSKNWTIPAALSDKKPKMLYGLVQQKKRPLTTFFTRFFDILDKETIDVHYTKKYSGYKMDRFNCVQKQKLFKELNDRDKFCKGIENRENKLNVSTSTGDLTPESLKILKNESSKSLVETENVVPMEKFDGTSESIEERVLTSSNDESENDAISEINEPRTPVQKMSSRIALFLENLRINRRKSSSLSSLPSYNLDTLFSDQEATPLSNCVATKVPIFLSSSDSDSFASKICKKICRKMKKGKQDDICKKRKPACQAEETECKRAGKSCRKKAADCGKRKDECKKEKCKAPCGENGARKSCGQKKQKDVCEKDKCKATCGDSEAKSCGRKKKEPVCKRDDKDKGTCKSSCGTCEEDPCKPYKHEKHHGAPCKKYEEDETYGRKDEDPCRKFRREDIHGKSCKDEEDPCKKLRTPEIHGKPCKSYRSDMGRGDPCCKFWKDEVHGGRCAKDRKPETVCCDDKKEDKMTELKKKKQTVKKKKVETMEKSEKDKCPPVIRAPGCPKDSDSGKPSGGGDDPSC
ncbi:hypothetical protein ANTQUA_LOCUS7365 [Anthophora quadrimaculata]